MQIGGSLFPTPSGDKSTGNVKDFGAFMRLNGVHLDGPG